MSFKDEAAALILKRGQLVKENDNYYWGWHDYSHDIGSYLRDKHEKGCHWVSTGESRIVEKTFYEFDGTDNDSSQETLLLLTDVDCSCGLLKGRRIGVQGTTGSLLHEILGIEVEYE